MNTTNPRQPAHTDADEIQKLRRCLRDLVALSALPAIWRSEALSGIAASLADALFSMLRVDLVYVQLQAARESEPNLAVRADGHPDLSGRAQGIGHALAPYLRADAAHQTQIVPHPIENGTLPLLCLPIDYAARGGYVAAGSRQPDFPTERDQLLCRIAANQAAEAIAHHNQVEEALRQMQQVAILEERNRLAREIHDTLAQGLTGIVIQLQVADRSGSSDSPDWRSSVRQARRLAEECLTEARRSVRALRSSALVGHDLANALQHLLEQMVHQIPIQSRFQVQGAADALPPEVENNMLRVAQEALTHALRYAHATEINVVLTYHPNRVRLRVEDNGRGFDPRRPGEEGFGLTGMRERAARMQASLNFVSQPGQGTIVELTVPTEWQTEQR